MGGWVGGWKPLPVNHFFAGGEVEERMVEVQHEEALAVPGGVDQVDLGLGRKPLCVWVGGWVGG